MSATLKDTDRLPSPCPYMKYLVFCYMDIIHHNDHGSENHWNYHHSPCTRKPWNNSDTRLQPWRTLRDCRDHVRTWNISSSSHNQGHPRCSCLEEDFFQLLIKDFWSFRNTGMCSKLLMLWVDWAGNFCFTFETLHLSKLLQNHRLHCCPHKDSAHL